MESRQQFLFPGSGQKNIRKLQKILRIILFLKLETILIVILHLNHPATALVFLKIQKKKMISNYLNQQGYAFVKVGELLKDLEEIQN